MVDARQQGSATAAGQRFVSPACPRLQAWPASGQHCLQDLGPLLRLETPTANWGYYRC